MNVFADKYYTFAEYLTVFIYYPLNQCNVFKLAWSYWCN